MNHFKKNIALYISFLLTVLFVVLIHFRLSDKNLSLYINSDSLYLSSFFRDIFQDHSKDIQWYLPAASCFFPDIFIFIVVHLFTANFIKAMFITGIVLNLLVIIAFYLLIKESVQKISPLFISVGINLLLLYHVAALYKNDYAFVNFLTYTNYHIGAYIGSLFSLYFAVCYLRRDKPGFLIPMIFFYSLTFSSDFLTVFFLTVPLLAVSILFFFKKAQKKQARKLLYAGLLGCILGLIIYGIVSVSNIFHLGRLANQAFNFSNIAKSYSTMLGHHWLYLKSMDVRALTMSLCILSFIISCIILVRKLIVFFKSENLSKNELMELVYLLLVVTQMFVVYNAPAINGVYSDGSILRYNASVFYISILNIGYLVYYSSKFIRVSKFANILSVIILLCFMFIGVKEVYTTDFSKGASRLFNYYPDYIRDIDKLSGQYNFSYGLADYWEARRITLLSKQNVKVYQTYKDLNPYFHTVNRKWYYGSEDGSKKAPVFEFVLPDNLIDSLVLKKIQGHIIDTLKTDNVRLIHTEPFIYELHTNKLIFLDRK